MRLHNLGNRLAIRGSRANGLHERGHQAAVLLTALGLVVEHESAKRGAIGRGDGLGSDDKPERRVAAQVGTGD
ncbi:MAG: hypothetical protein FJX57_17690, partial [Alphaproteobacteria bacterium]|nr:hypothetical protein [Alphaproteobacteria bacterium]